MGNVILLTKNSLIRSTLFFCAGKKKKKEIQMSKRHTSLREGHNVKLDFQTLLGFYGFMALSQTINFIYI